jgi:pyruvate dehydrogenase E2 component (dihydrolipoamide acetyltransferase)
MAIIVDMPRLSDTMEEGTIAGWLKEVGQSVAAGDGLAEIETDKAVMVFESFDKGVLLATLLAVGDTVPLGTPMAILGKAGEDITALKAEAEAKVKAALAAAAAPAAKKVEPEAALQRQVETPGRSAPAPAPALQRQVETPGRSGSPEAAEDGRRGAAEAARVSTDTTPAAPALALAPALDAEGKRIAASPLARRLAQQRGLDLASVPGSGPRGRIVAADLAGAAPVRRLSDRLARRVAREDEVVRVTQMRKTIAKRLSASMQDAPHYYLTIEVDAGRLVALRTDLNQALELAAPKDEKPRKVSYNDLVLRACVVALGRHPRVNAAWEGTTIRQFGGVHLGFAVVMPEGLITPVIRDADQLDLFELSDRVKDLAAKARDQQLEAHEYTGNSFCVSNLGMFGVDSFTAVINPPAACILAVGSLVEAPLVRGGVVSAGHRMTLTMSADHRAVDGATGAAFLADLRKVLEAPSALLL